MRPALCALINTGFFLLAATDASAAESSTTDAAWVLASQSGGVTIYSRPHPGSSLREFKAVGIIDAPTLVVWKMTSDLESYPSFMPFTAECRVLKREKNSVYIYQRISPGIVSDRDYTLRVVEKSWPSSGGMAYSTHWTSANDVGPDKRKGVLRIQNCEGSWLLEPETSAKTRATYTVFTDTGGSLPAWIANLASSIGIRKIFTAVRRQVKDPKYWGD